MTNPTDWPLIVSAMQQGGFYDRVMRGGPELDRVKQYLRAFAGAHAAGGGDPNQAPDYPCFPGLTHRPFHDAGGHEGAAMLEANVETVMTSPAITVTRDLSVLNALALMTRRRVRHLPVVENGAMVGFVSIGDLVKWRIDRIEAEAAAMREYIQAS